MTHADLVQHGVRWLRGRMKCRLVFAELSTSAWMIPDVIGWRMGSSVLLECKRTRKDFFSDREKFAHKHERVPGKHRWYLTPPGLIKEHEVPAGWGLIEARGRRTFTIVEAPKRVLTEQEHAEEALILTSAVSRLQTGRSQYNPTTAKFTAWR